MGKITVLEETTKNPITLMGKRAGICWGSDVSDNKKNYKRGLECLEANHGRLLEYVNVELTIDGYSAKCIREYYTHIGGLPSRLQGSTRYIDYAKGDGFKYVIPKSFLANQIALIRWKSLMKRINEDIRFFIDECGIPVEDATNALPLAYQTNMVDKRNLRNFIDMAMTRKCTRAYWEFREMFFDICEALSNISDEWKYIIDNYFKPKCEIYGYCTEKKSCGRKKRRGD